MRVHRSTIPPRWSAVVALALVPGGGCAASGADPPAGHRLDVIVEEVRTRPPAPARTVRGAAARAHFVGAPLPVVWGTLAAVYADLEIPANVLSAAEGRIGHRGYRRDTLAGIPVGEYLHCWSGEARRPFRVTEVRGRPVVALDLITSVRSSGTGTEVVTELEAGSSAAGSGASRCSSSGRLERLILERLEAHLWPGRGWPPDPL